MKTTIEIKEKLVFVQSEIDRINKVIEFDLSYLSHKFRFKDGSEHTEWTYDDALTSYIAQRSILRWILNIN